MRVGRPRAPRSDARLRLAPGASRWKGGLALHFADRLASLAPVSTPQNSAPPNAATTGDELPLLDLVVGVLRHRRLLAWVSVTSVVLTVGPLLVSAALGRREYSSEALLTTSARRNSSLSGLAAQFGIAVPGSDPTQSPAFFVDVMKSHAMLSALAVAKYPTQSGDSTTLPDHFRIKGNREDLRLARTRDALRDRVAVTSAQRSGIISLTATDRDPRVAQAILTRAIALLGDANIASRRTQASAERRFTEAQLTDARLALRRAEDEQRAFLQRNRDYRVSPMLTLEHDRLAREVGMRQQVFTMLAEAFEQAKIEEVRDTPVLTVVQAPYLPEAPKPLRFVLRFAIAAALGLGLGIILALGLEAFESIVASHPERAQELRDLIGRFGARKTRDASAAD